MHKPNPLILGERIRAHNAFGSQSHPGPNR